MLDWLSHFMPDWVATFLLSLVAGTIGVGMRLGHAAARANTWVSLRQAALEIPTVFGMTIIAGPIGRFLHSEYKVDLDIMFALCVLLTYLGAKALDRFANWFERRADADEDK